MTIDQYHDVLRGFFGSMKDFHVSVQFNATAASTLPFTVVGTNGHYYIEYIDRSKLPESSFPFHVGDELTALGGRSTADLVKQIVAQQGGQHRADPRRRWPLVHRPAATRRRSATWRRGR